MRFLFDTCAVSEHSAKHPNLHVLSWLSDVDISKSFLSVLSIGEIKKGIEMLTQSKRKKALEHWLQNDLMVQFDGNILEVTLEVMLVWGEMIGGLARNGHPISPIDSLIAAQALHGNYILVTRNEKDFKHTGITIFNPWTLDPNHERV
jgi:predicted nucleic acid-binding protein